MIAKILKIAGLIASFMIIAGISAYLTLSLIIKSEDTVVVPDLMGKDVVYALEVLSEFGLNTKVRGSEYSADTPKNHILFQEPEPGAEIKRGRDVKIILSKGSQSVWVPNLKGLSVRQAGIILDENGLCRGKLSRTHTRTGGTAVILAHTPPVGVMIKRGGCVDLLVNMGRRAAAYKMPDLTGLTLDRAISLMEEGNLSVVDIQTVFQEEDQENRVLDQAPPWGYRVVEGSRINLSVNRKHGEGAQGYTDEMRRKGIVRFKARCGFLNRYFRARIVKGGVFFDIYNGFIRPGEEIVLRIPFENVSLFLYEDDKLIRTRTFEPYPVIQD